MTDQAGYGAPHTPSRGLIAVLPFGSAAEDVIRIVADSIQGILKLPVDLLAPIPLPEGAFLPARQQYNAMALIKYIAAEHAGGHMKVLGITSRDIANPILTYVFGEAYMNGTASIMSYARLGTGAGPESVSREMLLDRAVKVGIHEIGHTFNIPHCHHDRCVMRGSHNIMELDGKLNYLCAYCEIFMADAIAAWLKEHQVERGKGERKAKGSGLA